MASDYMGSGPGTVVKKTSSGGTIQVKVPKNSSSKASGTTRNTLPTEQAEELKKVIDQEQANIPITNITPVSSPSRYASGPAVPQQAQPYRITGSLVTTPTESGLTGEALYEYQSRVDPASRLVSDRATMEHAIALTESGMSKAEVKAQLIAEGVDVNQTSLLSQRASTYTRNPALFEKNYGSAVGSAIKPSQSKTWQREMASLKNTLASKAGEIATEWDTLRAPYLVTETPDGNPRSSYTGYMGVENTAKGELLRSQFQSLQAESDALGRLGRKTDYSMGQYNRIVGGGLGTLRDIETYKATQVESKVQTANLEKLIQQGAVIVLDEHDVPVTKTDSRGIQQPSSSG